MLFVQYHKGQLSTSCMKLVLERPVIRPSAYCKPTRYKYSITARWKFCSSYIHKFKT